MRVSLDDSVFDHIPRLAREMKWDEDRALGVLVRVYRATQREKVYEERPGRLVTICAMLFPDDETAERFFTAMLSARLAVMLEDGKLRIRGNKKRIEEQEDWLQGKREAGRRGGIAKANNAKSSIVSLAQASTDLAKPSETYRISLSNSIVEEGEGKEAAPPPPFEGRIPKLDTTTLALHYGTYCSLLKQIRNREAPPRPTKKAGWALEAVAVASGAHMTQVLEVFIRDPNPFYDREGWPLELLEKDHGKIYQRVKQPAASTDLKAKKQAEHERAKQAAIEQYEREQGLRT